MRFHIRVMYEDGTPVIVKEEGTDILDAITQAAKKIRSADNVNVAGLRTLRVRPLTSKSSSVYVGQKPTRKGKPRATKTANGATPAPATAPAATPASASTQAGKPVAAGKTAGK